jgi:SAM-dependent methyltransferase
MNDADFMGQFDSDWGPRLKKRRHTFRRIFEFLLRKKNAGHLIIETGCARTSENWEGDGQSTYLFDRFAEAYDGHVYSVDIDPKACEYARSIVGPRTEIATGESVKFLQDFAVRLRHNHRMIDLLYLDSFDWGIGMEVASAVHHLKELCAIAPALQPGCLVVVDDAFRNLHGYHNESNDYALVFDMGIGGKGKYVAEFFQAIGTPLVIDGYQCGWVVE